MQTLPQPEKNFLLSERNYYNQKLYTGKTLGFGTPQFLRDELNEEITTMLKKYK
jgi:hypothetical protein